MQESWRGTLRTYFRILPSLLAFEILYNLLTILLLKPVLGFITQTLLGWGGYNLVFNENILSIFTNFLGILAALLLAGAAVILIFYEFSVQFLMIYYHLQGQEIRLSAALELSVTTLKSLTKLSPIGAAVYILGILPLADLGLTSSLLPSWEIPRFVTGELTKTIPGSLLIGFFYLLLYLLCMALLFVMPSMALGRLRFGKAVKQGWAISKTLGFRAWGTILLFLAAWYSMYHWPGLVPKRFPGITGTNALDFLRNLFAGQVFSLLPSFLLAGLLRICLSLFFMTILTMLYLKHNGTVDIHEEALPVIASRVELTRDKTKILVTAAGRKVKNHWGKISAHPFYQKHKKLFYVCAGLLAVIWAGSLFAAPPTLHVPIAIGHRGSAYGVENTLEALQGAIDGGADFAEVDILLSSDGVPMVIHDTNLSRLAGDNRNVYDLTAQELSQLTLSQNGYTGKISTLKEVVDYCRDKIRLVVELKTHGHETSDIVRQVIQTVEEEGFSGQCLFMSLDYGLMERMRMLMPDYTIGYCVYGNVGKLNYQSLLNLDVDFLTIEESMVTPEFVGKCRRSWIPVYVWTVDNSDDMDVYLREGVTGIVSDYPDIAKTVVRDYNNGEELDDFFNWDRGPIEPEEDPIEEPEEDPEEEPVEE